MKKIMMLFFALIFLFSAKDVFAQDQYQLSLEKQDGIYFSRRGVNFDDDSYPFYLYKFGNIFAYCIEPGKHITTYTYTGVEDYVDLGFSEELKEKLELIGYYGREYPGHNNVRYSMAAQALIWELTGVDTVTFWTKQYEQGEEIDVSNERNEIMRLVNNHKTLPNFGSNYYGYLKKELTIYDSNKVLGYYDIIDDGGNNVYIDANTLHITPQKVGLTKIKLKRKSYDEYNTIIFVGQGDNSSQKLGRLHFNKEIVSELNLNTSGFRLLVHKVDENNNAIHVKNIQFKIKNLNTGEYLCNGTSTCIYNTNNNGMFYTELLDYGEYEIEEVVDQLVQGYALNREKLRVKVDENTIFNWDNSKYNYVDVYFKNYTVDVSIELTKTKEIAVFNNNSVTYQEENLGNIWFDIYTLNDELVTSGVTDNNGKLTLTGLKIGKYYLVERTKLPNYRDRGKMLVTLKQQNAYHSSIIFQLSVKNELIKGDLEFSKVDSKTNKGIPNTIIEIYDSNNKLLFTKETDNNGKITINDLPIGKYYIKEKEANYYYEKTSEVVNFEIKNHDEIVHVKMTNDKLTGKLEIEKLGEELSINDNNINYKEIKLSNIEFDLYNDNNEFITTLKTNNKGYATYNLELGKYYIKEKTKLNNYKDNSNKYSFEIKKDNGKAIPVKLTINNYLKKGNLEINKIDSITNIGISDTIINIYNDKNELLLTKKTDNNGKIIINNLPIGKYYIKEKEANYYYKMNDEVINFEIKNDNEVIKKTITNEKILGKLEINKKAENFHFINNDVYYDKETIHSIEFDLYDINNNLIDHIITDNNGYAQYDNLSLGRYYLIEKTGLPRFSNIGNKIYFDIRKKDLYSAIDVNLEIVNYLKKGSLEFSKIDYATSSGIPNTIIEIYNENDLLLFTQETDKDGKVIIPSLPFGKYYIKEKEANYYYEKTDEKVYFEVKEDGEIIKAKMDNKKILGNIEIIKKGEEYHIIDNKIVYDKETLHSIEFDIYDSNDKLVGSMKTDDYGYAIFSNLPLGNYYLIEKTKLDNYIENSNKISFKLDKDNYNKAINVSLVIDNYLKKGSLEFIKQDDKTNVGIPDTVIEIYNENDVLLFTEKTNKEGKIIINSLPYGKYYIKEKEANYYYEKTDEVIPFEIKENGKVVKVKMNNKKIVGSLEIEKYGEEYQIIDEEVVYQKIKLSNIEFDLYDTNDNLITTLTTNENGIIKYDELPLGKYYLIEKTKLDNYVDNNDKIYFEIKKDNGKAIPVKLEITNYLKKGNLEFTKLDLTTKEGIPNTIIEIYDENNNLWFSKTTDELGKVIIPNLPIGKYYIIEKEANSLYMITNEKVYFEIKENGEIVKASMTNEKIEVPVYKTNTKESVIANTLFGIGLLIGLGRFYYEKKESC